MDLPRAARPTRGRRLSKLVQDEVEADEAFWSQDAFKEEAVDKEYEAEEEVADEFDSDFDDEEDPETDEGDVQEEKETKKRKKKLPYKGADKRRKSVSFLLGGASIPRIDKSERSKPKKKTSPRPKAKDTASDPQPADDENAGEEEKTLRKSTRTAVVSKQAAREAKQQLQITPKPVKKKKEGERKLTQEDMLLEAAQTEVINLQSLERMLAREEEVKKKAIVQKKVYNGALVRVLSKNGHNIVEFTKATSFPSIINAKAPPYPERTVCVVTGLPAKYKDPKTGLPYANKEAFKFLRERYDKPGSRKDIAEEIRQRKRTRVETERSPGVVRLKFLRGSGLRDAIPTRAGPAAPVVMEPVNEADFVLDDLEVKSNYSDGYYIACDWKMEEPNEIDVHVTDAMLRRI